MKKTLDNVHVVIYSKKMLKEAVERLKKLGQEVEMSIFDDFEHHGNDLLRFHNGEFKIVHHLYNYPNFEITLNDLCEIIIDKKGEKTVVLEVGKWYKDDDVLFCHQEGDKSFGFLFGEWVKTPWVTVFENVNLSLATPEEVEKALIAEAKKRGYVDGVSIKSPKHNWVIKFKEIRKFQLKGNSIQLHADAILTDHKGDHDYKGSFENIFQDGRWAEIIEVDKFADLKKAHAEGKIIQWKRHDTGNIHWEDCENNYPLWHEYNQYRIKPEPKVKMGDYVITELKNSPSPGFSVYQLSIQNSVDALNAEDTPHNFKIITKERFEELRKVSLC